MTWNEFKNYIDKKLEELGKNGEIEIASMDFSYPSEGIIFVEVDKEDGLVVSN